MKKISYWALAVTAMAFVACDEVDKSLAEPSTNPQEAIFEASNLSVTPAQGAINLQALAGQNAAAEVGTYTVSEFPESSTLHFVMQFSADPEFAEFAEIPGDVAVVAVDMVGADAAEGAITVDPAAFDDAYYKKVTQNPEQAVVNVRFIAQAVNGTEVARIGGPDTYFGEGTLTVTPFAPAEDSYYLVNADDDSAAPVKMSHSDKAGWEDPVFMAIVEAPADGFAWAIESGSTVEGTDGSHAGKVFVPEDNSAMSGKLVAVAQGETYAPGMIPEGPYKLEVNMRDMTYQTTLAIKQLYTPGNSNGWSFEASQILTTYNYVKYTGYVHIDGEFKFTAQPAWDGLNFGMGDEDGHLSTDPTAKNLSAENGLYWCTVDVIALTFKDVQITSLGLIGGFNGWGGQENLEPSADFLTWTGTVDMEEGQEFKFRANDNWDINLGGALDALTLDGANLVAPGTGTYAVTLDLSAVPYTATLVQQ